MAMLEDIVKGNAMAGLAVGVGAIMLGPTLLPAIGKVLRPAAKAVIKGGMLFYRETIAEIGEVTGDIVAEARAELEQEGRAESPGGGRAAARASAGAGETERKR